LVPRHLLGRSRRARSSRRSWVVGFLHSGTAGSNAHLVDAFRRGLAEASYVEGRNVTIKYRWAEGQYDRLAGLAAELVRRPVAVISGGAPPAALAAKAATTTIPVVFRQR
jgi:putative ABC transport system substrate-binding protein